MLHAPMRRAGAGATAVSYVLTSVRVRVLTSARVCALGSLRVLAEVTPCAAACVSLVVSVSRLRWWS